jgi:tetratricopeptide (TPR) repeat protein
MRQKTCFNTVVLAVVSLLLASGLRPAMAEGEPANAGQSEWSDAKLRLIASSGDKNKFIEALWSFANERPNEPDRLAYAASLADVAGANKTALKLYSEFKKRFAADPRNDRIDQLIKRVQEEEAQCPESFVDAASESDFFLVDTIRKHAVRWSADRNPIKVCVHQSSTADATPVQFLSISKSLFNDWANASGGRIKFTFVEDPSTADIDVMWTRDRSKSPLPGKQGVTTYEWKNASVNKSKIVCLSMRYLSDTVINEKSAKHVVIHEIGHALGLGHSKNIHDCMYFGNMTPDEDATITVNDKAMLQKLYTTADEQLENAAMECATKYGAPQLEMIAAMLQDWSDVASAQGNYARSEKLLLQARQIFDKSSEAVPAEQRFQNTRDLARVLRQQNKLAEAIPYYIDCVATMQKNHNDDDDLITVLQNLSACQRSAGQYAECKNTCLTLLPLVQQRKPGSDALATLYMELGTLSFNEREFVKAEQYYKKSCDTYAKLSAKPSTEDARMAQQNHQISLDYLNSDVYKDKVELPFSGKGDVRDWYKANELYRQGNRLLSEKSDEKLNAAVIKYREAIKLYAFDAAYYYNLANTLMRLKKTTEAASTYATAAELNPSSFTMTYWHGVASYTDKKFDEAKSAFQKAVLIKHTPSQQQDIQRFLDYLSIMTPAAAQRDAL